MKNGENEHAVYVAGLKEVSFLSYVFYYIQIQLEALHQHADLMQTLRPINIVLVPENVREYD